MNLVSRVKVPKLLRKDDVASKTSDVKFLVREKKTLNKHNTPYISQSIEDTCFITLSL